MKMNEKTKIYTKLSFEPGRNEDSGIHNCSIKKLFY
jgi:hypothetical protein